MDKTTSPKPNLSANSVMRGLLESIIILRSLAETIEQQLSSHYHHYTSRCSSPWLEQSIADHLQNSERLPWYR